MHAATPGAHERKVESSAEGGAGHGNQARSPLACHFRSESCANALCDLRGKFSEDIFFGEAFAVIEASGRRCRLPHFRAASGVIGCYSVEQGQTPGETDQNGAEKTCVGEDGDDATKTESHALDQVSALGSADERFSDGVEAFERNVLQASEVRKPDVVPGGELPPEGLGISSLQGGQKLVPVGAWT